jgi:hypothetical protein
MAFFSKYYDCDERDTMTCYAPIKGGRVCRIGSDEWKEMMKQIARSQLLPPVELLVDVREQNRYVWTNTLNDVKTELDVFSVCGEDHHDSSSEDCEGVIVVDGEGETSKEIEVIASNTIVLQ